MEHWRNLLEGARRVLVLDAGGSYIRPARDGFAGDAERLRADSRRIASDLDRVTRKHDQPINDRKTQPQG